METTSFFCFVSSLSSMNARTYIYLNTLRQSEIFDMRKKCEKNRFFTENLNLKLMPRRKKWWWVIYANLKLNFIFKKTVKLEFFSSNCFSPCLRQNKRFLIYSRQFFFLFPLILFTFSKDIKMHPAKKKIEFFWCEIDKLHHKI